MEIQQEPKQFLQDQYGHLPQEERPITGPCVDVTSALQQNKEHRFVLSSAITSKRLKTANWITSQYPGFVPIYLTRPDEFKNNPEIQHRLAEWMNFLIQKVYRGSYPLEGSVDAFQGEIEQGTLLPYLGLIGPDGFNNGEVFYRPELLLDERVIPVQTAAIIRGRSGFAELGRNAKDGDYFGFEGGAITLERSLDYLRNRFRMLERAHTLTTDMRAADEHHGIQSAGAVQYINLNIGRFRIKIAAPMYVVGGALEPFLSALNPRDLKKYQDYNSNRAVFTPPGAHIELLNAIWKHQVGSDLKIESISENGSKPYGLASIKVYSGKIYSTVDVIDEADEQVDPKETQQLYQALLTGENMAPVVLVKVSAETVRSAATQQFLLSNGYVVCGIEGARREEYLEPGNCNGDYVLRDYQSPVYLYMIKLGKTVKNGEIEIAPPFYVDNNLLTPELRGMLYNLDEQIRRSVANI